MIRRTRALMSGLPPPGAAGTAARTKTPKPRTVVRDPRTARKANGGHPVVPVASETERQWQQQQQQQQQQFQLQQRQEQAQPQPSPPPLPFRPTDQNQESVGSSLVSYGLAGVGVAMGVTLVRVLLGA